MSDPIVAEHVCRYALNGVYLDRPCVNLLDMVIHVESGTGDRETGVTLVANNLLNAWYESILPFLNHSYAFESVSWVDLNSLDGSTGSISASTSHSLPATGGDTGESYSANVSILVTKRTTSARGQRNGRWFLPPTGEANILGNTLSPAFVTSAEGLLSDFIETMTETGVVQGYTYFPTVVHTHNAGTPQAPVIVYEGNTQITDFSVRAKVATQKRRLGRG